MRKLPRRLPSNSPSLAWVAFAVLLLALGGGLAGLYTHQQNQESAKLRLIRELKREIELSRERAGSHRRSIDSWVRADNLMLELKKHDLRLQPVDPKHRVLLVGSPAAAPDPAAAEPNAESHGSAVPSVMATVSRP
ncbi:MAG: hypothetical protein ACKV19_03035 [Verrucomicrobiales bacterium]